MRRWTRIRPVLSSNGLEADPVKKDAVDRADQQGEIFSTLFVLFGQFSVAAGMLLIFLIFVMLAAERKHELGMARAVGMQRSNLVRAFAFEGALYALVASAVGSVAGVGVGWVMVRLLGKGFAGGSEDFRIVFATSPQNVVLAFCMGMVLTFAVVLLSSWRVSRLNVVRAIRDIPEPDKRGPYRPGRDRGRPLPHRGGGGLLAGAGDGDDGLLPGRPLAGPDRGRSPGARPRDARPRRLHGVGAGPARAVADPGLHHDASRDGARDRRCSSSLA